ncbi:TetR/AcrR family transcriptional regulator [Mesorhizobium sp. 10J20-29]
MAEKVVSEPRNIRLAPDRRAKLILNRSIEFFGKNGFSGTMRELADHCGVSSGLILKYFGTKEHLLDQVFDSIFIDRWEEERLVALVDRSVEFRVRLKNFYAWFFEITDDFNWIRTGIFSGLTNQELSRRHYELQVRRILEAVALELREERGDADKLTNVPPEMWELEVAWTLHSTFIQWNIRNHVFGRPVWRDKQGMVELVVDLFIDGCFVRPATRT